jgi:hypothetical protein
LLVLSVCNGEIILEKGEILWFLHTLSEARLIAIVGVTDRSTEREKTILGEG